MGLRGPHSVAIQRTLGVGSIVLQEEFHGLNTAGSFHIEPVPVRKSRNLLVYLDKSESGYWWVHNKVQLTEVDAQ